MTVKARAALQDCRDALDDLRTAKGSAWRTRWVACVALLRAVGHVLDKVDGPTSTSLRLVIDQKWGEPKPPIFTEFIETERNNVLKAYVFRARQHVTVRPGPATDDSSSLDDPSLGSGPTTYEHVLDGGPFEGRDPRELIEEAISFWTSYLDDVEVRWNGPSSA